MKKKEIIVRMPPSPTGPLHLGTARTALFNYLFAKKNKGKIIFRWEDTDIERSQKKFETEILGGLKWLGLDFEKESEKMYRQTENNEIHKQFLKKLWEDEKIFPCFVTPEEIQSLRERATKKKFNFVFWSPFREESRTTLQNKMDSGIPFVWRIKCLKNKTIIFNDLIRGHIEANSNTLGDFAIARSDGSVLYLLANVIDDFTQGITHVLRGEDHISNTPKQILLYEALGVDPPAFGHIPLVLDQQKRKLSKRNVDPNTCVLVPDFQAAGFLPEAVLNGLAFLGWNPKSTQEIFSIHDLIEAFYLQKVNPGAAQYDFEKMKWFNMKWLKTIPIEKLIEHFNFFAKTQYSLSYKKAFEVAREKSRDLIDIQNQLEYLLSDPGIDVNKFINEKFRIDIPFAKNVLTEIEQMLLNIPESKFNKEFLREKSIQKIEKLGIANGQFLGPFRIALSNREVSAGPFEIADTLGKQETLRRIQRSQKV
ncbi:glutamate--tRNA ligase [Candidatus Gracilibacteria bacterium]|nr:glutamate--tRNA ligase [Candidatus Gracilibacteria bacterium]